MIYDFHLRIGPVPEDPSVAADRLLGEMDRHGITRGVACAGGLIDPVRLARQIVFGGHLETDADNERVLAVSARSGGRLTPFYFANPHRQPRRYLDAAPSYRGLEISPAVHGVGLDDPRTVALVEVAAQAGHPVYVVCLGRPGATVGDLVTLAGKFPEARFVLGHCGFIGIDFHAVATIAETGNIFAETSGCYTSVARVAVQRLGADRVVFGSEYPAQDFGVELAKCRALALTDDELHRVTWASAVRLLREDAP
ncbi:amidohydrolase family protein [Plantactinospora sp. S1510]|uniref:Amidohydrolase family protein n=1 Tax=Plantactinospora alkalitolerans TaxID=2789879 RepID=A0ABS0H7L5_9ACTN|nr:amidohydrolase family protein [Plantactinospora alkalitolerans]MBF9134463.1 amidohydrolase family protein [Plantactinospora alkalitolerans]